MSTRNRFDLSNSSRREPKNENDNNWFSSLNWSNRLIVTRCPFAAISACDSSSTKDLVIVTSNSTRAIKNIGANIARPPFLEGQFLSVSVSSNTWSTHISCRLMISSTCSNSTKLDIFFGGEISFDLTNYSGSVTTISLVVSEILFQLFLCWPVLVNAFDGQPIGNHISTLYQILKNWISMLNNYWVTFLGRKNLVPLKVKKRKEILAFYFEGKQKYIFFLKSIKQRFCVCFAVII